MPPKSSCLAGIDAGIKPFIEAATAADIVITIASCEVGCAKKITRISLFLNNNLSILN
ncbi:putative zinc-binding protein [Pelosinus sp. IPA-1]|uniref:putative zinc-binding protein n=1 Tax=Pelosinus sp. IPA-1 TaxID=3029569 RepID=UPI00333403B6